MKRTPFILVAALSLPFATPARATYSIAATHAPSRQVGGAGTSCVAPNDVYVIYGSAPGFGIIMAQSYTNTAGRDRGVTMMKMGSKPSEVIAAITATSFDSQPGLRQYGVAAFSGDPAGYTGAMNSNYAEDRHKSFGGYTVTVQGNILTSKAVIDQAHAAFENTGCDLPQKLMLALEAGAAGGQGDSRCTSMNPSIPSNSGFIQVDREGEAAGSYLKLKVVNSGKASPMIMLRTMFDSWRATHPCWTDAAGDGGTDSGGGSDGGGSDGAGGSGGAGGSAGAGGGGAGGGGGSGGSGSGDAGVDGLKGAGGGDSGCGCHVASGVAADSLAGYALLALAAALAKLRRR